MQVTLSRDNAWVQDLGRRNKVLVAAMGALKAGNYEPYKRYWVQRTKGKLGTWKEVGQLTAELYSQMVNDIYTRGYNPSIAQALAAERGRQYGGIRLTVEAGGKLEVQDGNHRFAAWYSNQNGTDTLTADVSWIEPEWQTLLEGATYQEYDHPAWLRPGYARQGLARYEAVSGLLGNQGRILDLGSCLGLGTACLARGSRQVYGCEHNPIYRKLAEARWAIQDQRPIGHVEHPSEQQWDVVVALSVYHHLASSMSALQAWAEATKCSELYVELPEPGSTTWHEPFLQECGGTDPYVVVLDLLCRINNRTALQVVFRDPNYAHRTVIKI